MRLTNRLLALQFIVFSGSCSFAQEEAVPTATLNYYINNYAQKGILVDASEIQNLNQADLERIDNFNFDAYRRLNSDQQIELDNNQKVTLKSLNYLISQGVVLDNSLLNLKSNEPDEANLTQAVVKVRVSIGYQKVDSQEYWEVK